MLGQPLRRRIPGHRKPQQLSPSMSQDDKSKQALKRQSWNNAEIDCRNHIRMVAQEGSPILGWRSLPSDHVLGDRRLGEFEPKLKQFAADARGAPQRVLLTHPPDQIA